MIDRHVKIYDFVLIMFVNIFCMLISMIISVYLRYGMVEFMQGMPREFNYRGIIYKMMLISIFINLCIDFNHHFFRRGAIDEFLSVVKQQFVFALSLVLWLYLTHDSASLSRLVFTYYVIIDTLLCFAGHIALKEFMFRVAQRSRSASRLLILTTRDKAKTAIENILPYNEWYRTIVGVAILDKGFSVDEYKGSTEHAIDGVNIVTDRNGFMDYVVHNAVDEVLIMDNNREHIDATLPWARTLEEMGVTVDVDIDIFDFDLSGRKNIGRVGKYAVVTFNRNELSSRQLLAKRCLDIAGSLVGCVILALASVIVVPAIKLDSEGPALFKQKRVGKNGRIFTLYKFRSMYNDAEERKAALLKQNEMKGLMFKMNDDPRITRVGKFIRRTSIDELPQFINILKGDMSLVGTRPPTVDEYMRYEAQHKCRLSMTPGLTGMWQVSGRSDVTDFDDVVKLDMKYIDDWTIAKDIRILLKTVKIVALRTGSR